MFEGLERLPGAPHLHRWADWAELLTFTSADGSLSMTELVETSERRAEYLAEEGEDDQDPSEHLPEQLINEADGEASSFRDALAQRAGDVMLYLRDRSIRYGSTYPFDLDVNMNLVSLRAPTLSRNIYLFMLSCASFRYVPDRSTMNSFAAGFELLGAEVLKRALPSAAEVHLFGTSPANEGRYKGTLQKKIEQLCLDLGERCLASEKDFEKGDRGDNGLDLVAWVPLGDSLPGRLTVFGQVACTSDWISKQHSSQASSWSSVMTLMTDPLNMVFIPFDYRRPGNEWYTDRHIHKSAVIDRFRVIRILSSGADAGDPVELSRVVIDKLDLAKLEFGRGQEASDL